MLEQSSHIEDKRLNSNTVGLLDRLVDIHELGEVLGYDDVRSVKSWCKRSGIPLFQLGKRTYTISTLLDEYLGDLLGVNIIPVVDSVVTAKTTRQESVMSEASKKFLDEE